MSLPLLSIRNLRAMYGGVQVLHDIALDIHAGEALGLIGESGSGKSLTALACMGLLPSEIAPMGSIRYKNDELMQLDTHGWRAIRGRQIGIVFQDPMASLNPIMTVGAQILENLRPVDGEGRAARRTRAIDLLAEVGLPDPRGMLKRYPFELSGGQQQRAMIAMVLAAEPALMIADEPTTALDVTTQAQILKLLRDIQHRRGMALLFISHDLDAVLAMSDRVAVMWQGRLVEQGTASEILLAPRHEYTRALMAAHGAHRAPREQQTARDAAAAMRGAGSSGGAGRQSEERNYGVSVSVSGNRDGNGISNGNPLASGLLPDRGEAALVLESLCVDYGRWRPKRALQDVSLRLEAGATLGIAGESGSGKSTLAQAVMGLLKPSAGLVRVFGMDPADEHTRPAFARICQYVFQDTSGSLNPRRTLLQALIEPLAAQGIADRLRSRCAAMLEEVGLDAALLDRHPHQLSGGQRQRVVIARALAMHPRVLICDEPVSALDATVRNQILALLAELRSRHGLTLVFIGHDLNVMESLVDQVLVMRQGMVVEQGAVDAVFGAPRHAYTRELLQAGRLSAGLRVQAESRRFGLPSSPDLHMVWDHHGVLVR